MIWESSPWKQYLARSAANLRRRKRQKRWTAASLAALEREVFFSAYAVRKLLEAGKISDEAEARPLRAAKHLPSGRTVDFLNWDKLDELYLLSARTEIDLPLREFCNQIIHSFVFTPTITDRGGLGGFFVTSERDKNKRLLYFAVDDVARSLARVANDIVDASFHRDFVGGPAKITKKSSISERARGRKLH